MRIALLTDGIAPYVTGGMQRHSFNLCRSLVRNGAHVDLYHCDPLKRGASKLDCFTEEERAHISPELIEFPDFGKLPGHYMRESFEYSRKVAASLQGKVQPDFIYAKGFTAWELLNLKSKGQKFPPIGVNLHGYEMFQKQPSIKSSLGARLFLQPPARFAVKHADYLFSYGGKITDLIRSLGVSENRIAEIPGGIGDDWIADSVKPALQPIRLLFVGRQERRKGILELNEAIKRLFQTHKGKFTFSFIGPFEYSDRVKGCNYFGELTSKAEIQKAYSECDVLVVPSHSEGMPNVILEGMACGLAIAATDVGAVSMLTGAANGWIIQAPTPESIYNTLVTIAEASVQEVLEKKKASFEMVKSTFSWSKIGNMTMEFIRKAIA